MTPTSREKVFQQFCNENYEYFFRIILSKVQNPEEAKDISQDAFLKLHKYFATLNSITPRVVASYFTILLRTTIADHYRKKNSGSFINSYKPSSLNRLEVTTVTTSMNSADYVFLEKDLEEFIESNLVNLDKEILRYFFQEDMSAEEVGNKLGKSPKTIRNRSLGIRKKILNFLSSVLLLITII
jgi:RNA polymerase sigma factor (sigma-70 family)